jgi:hypothetical protein
LPIREVGMSEWIKCSDRMPEYGRYLVWHDNPYGNQIVLAQYTKYFYCANSDSFAEIWLDDRSRSMTSMQGVEYWMPIPELPL